MTKRQTADLVLIVIAAVWAADAYPGGKACVFFSMPWWVGALIVLIAGAVLIADLAAKAARPHRKPIRVESDGGSTRHDPARRGETRR